MAQASDADGQSLQDAANDPTASLMAFQLQDFYSASLHNSPETANSAQVRAAVPFRLWGSNHIFRLTQPYVTDSASGASGISETTIFDLVTFDRSWGRFGLGAVALLPNGASDLSAKKWAVGPAAGFVA